jgi:hypothetical protein
MLVEMLKRVLPTTREGRRGELVLLMSDVCKRFDRTYFDSEHASGRRFSASNSHVVEPPTTMFDKGKQP